MRRFFRKGESPVSKNRSIPLPPYVETAIKQLESHGFQAWCVGGCVRDSLLGNTPHDWDIATSALPEETLASFPGQRLLQTGISHGTITLLPAEGTSLEITTFRTESGYSDNRHPDQVRFSTSLEEDLSRRDFTVNAMAYHPVHGIVDPFGGQRDLEQKTLRAVGDPCRRFAEDALRILRGLRFASQLCFTIESHTSSALVSARHLLQSLSPERVQGELTKLLCGPSVLPVLQRYASVLFSILPELAPMEGCTQETPYHCYDVWEHTLHAIDHAAPEPALRWALLLHDAGKPEAKIFSPEGRAHFYGHPAKSGNIARQVLARLRFPKKEQVWIGTLVDHHEAPLPMTEKQLKDFLGRYGAPFTFQLLALIEADMSAKAPGVFERRLPDIQLSRRRAETILARGDCLQVKDLAVHGDDLLQLGIPAGPSIGALLQFLLQAVQDGTTPNQKDALLQAALQWQKEQLP